MTTGNRRKENKYEAKAEESGRNLVPPLNSAMVDKAEREESILPDNQRYSPIPRIEGVVNDYNIQEAMKAVAKGHGEWLGPMVCIRRFRIKKLNPWDTSQ